MPPKPRLPSPRVRTPSPPRPSPQQSGINPPKGLGGVINEKVVQPAKEATKDKQYTTEDLLDRSGI